jgi:tRNA-Thr(GGU) m(6)t(6)A37 methyltransferase TsaA
MSEPTLSALPEPSAELVFIGRIRTPWRERSACPRNSRESGETARVEIDAAFRPALLDLDTATHVILLYWLDRARRDLLVQSPPFDDRPHGTFALRSPNRPNPIGLSVCELVSVEPGGLIVRHIDCLDGTPLLDIKPYFASTDSVPQARVGWHERRAFPGLRPVRPSPPR